jgi:hypothetical protein
LPDAGHTIDRRERSWLLTGVLVHAA